MSDNMVNECRASVISNLDKAVSDFENGDIDSSLDTLKVSEQFLFQMRVHIFQTRHVSGVRG